MRKLILAAGMLACLSLAGCSSEPAPEAKTEAEAPKKSLARQVQFYQGQDNVQAIESGAIKAVAGGGYDLEAKVTTDGGGWTKVGFLPRVYAATPPDGIYEVDVVGDKPATPGAAGPTPVEVKSGWDRYKDGRVKGVKFISKTNEVVAMVPGA
jgi:outer membrane murein-binding lipoprotein Lpp